MGDLTKAWQRALELIERGDGYERCELDDCVIYDWGEDRLRHTLYHPVSAEDLRAFEDDMPDLPPALRELLTEHADGLDLLGGDLVIWGISSTEPPRRSISFVEDHKTGRVSAMIGTLGADDEPLYLDPDGRVVLSAHGAATWPSLGDLLVAVLEEGLEQCWDDDGRRTGELRIGDAAPTLGDDATLDVPSDMAERLEAVRGALDDAPRTVAVGDARYDLVAGDELGEAQVGFRIDPGGDDLTGDDDGDWLPTWIVIGTDEDVGDPLFVDLADGAVHTAVHGTGSWDPEQVAESLEELLKR